MQQIVGEKKIKKLQAAFFFCLINFKREKREAVYSY